MKSETIVVGGGIAGMSCALKLKEHDREVALITEELGGRICYDPQLKNNFGAVFFMENYKNAKKLVSSTGLMAVDLKDLMLHSSETKVFRGTSLTMVKSLPQMLKFLNFMKAHFMPDYNRYKNDFEHMPIEKAFKRHPSIRRCLNMRASDFIEELGIDTVADKFVSKFAYACTGSKIKELNALDFFNVAQGVVIPIYDFSFDAEAYTVQLDGKVFIETIAAITKAEDGWTLTTSTGEEHMCSMLLLLPAEAMVLGMYAVVKK